MTLQRRTLGIGLLASFFLAMSPAAAEQKGARKIEERDILLEKDALGVMLKTQTGGPHVTGEDLAGRVVLFIFSGPGDAKWNEFLVRMGSQYLNAAPPGGLVTIFVLPAKNTECRWWTDGRGSPWVSFYNEENFAMPGFGYAGLPRFILFDADGRMVGDICHDGRDLSGNSVHTYGGTRFTPDVIRKTVETGSGAIVKAGASSECADETRKLIENGLTASSLTPVLTALRKKATDGKGAARNEATALLDGLHEYLDRQYALIERNTVANPVLAMRALKRALAQVAGDKEFAPRFEKLQERLKADKAFQDELKPAEMLYAIRAQAAFIKWGLLDPDEPPRPKDKVQAVKQGLEEIIAKYAKSRAAQTATELKKAYTEWAGKAIDPTPW